MNYPRVPQPVQPPVGVAIPYGWSGEDLPDGDRSPFLEAPVGATYVYIVSNTSVRWYTKVKDDSRDDDWCCVRGVISERLVLADFTGALAVGTCDLATQIPAGAWFEHGYLLNVTGFSGDTSAVITVGDGSTADRYNTGTPSVFTTSDAIDLGAPSGTQIHTAAKTVTVTITSGSAWSSVSAGALTIRLLYTM